MSKNDTRKTKDVLDEIVEVLLDISESLTDIAASLNRPAGVAEVASLSDADIASLTSVLHSDGGVNFATGTTKTFRTYGDPTVLSGDEEGLK